jgi:hypothetical protein
MPICSKCSLSALKLHLYPLSSSSAFYMRTLYTAKITYIILDVLLVLLVDAVVGEVRVLGGQVC